MTMNADFFIFQIAIAFPDDGSWKRFHKQLHHFPMVLYIYTFLMWMLYFAYNYA